MDLSLTTEVMAIFVIFWTILAKIWLPWQRPLDPCNQKCLIWIGRPRKPLVISNRIFLISRRNAYICIYRNFCRKIGCHGNAPLSLVYGSVADEFPDGTNPISKSNAARMCCLQQKLWPFCDFLAYFGQNLVAMATSLVPLQSKMSYLIWIGRPIKPYPGTKNFVNSCCTSEVMSIRRFATSLALPEYGIFGIFAINMENYF